MLSATEVLALNMAVVDLIGRRLCNWLSFRFMGYTVERVHLGISCKEVWKCCPLVVWYENAMIYGPFYIRRFY